MDIKQIQELIKFISRSGVNEVSIEQEDFKITIKTNQQPVYQAQTAQQIQPVSTSAIVVTPASPVETKPAAATIKDDSASYITVKSPMIGTFYRSSSPDKPLLVNAGDEIKAGQVVCIIEAMKLFNEIESEISGRIVKVLVDNASPVEYDQPLFLVEPI